MHYLCLVFFHRAALDALPHEQRARLREEMADHERALADDRRVASLGLLPADAALRLFAPRGRAQLETVVGTRVNAPLQGFYRLEARDLNEAVRLAGELPLGRLGCIEIRAEDGWDRLFDRSCEHDPQAARPVRPSLLETCHMNNPATSTGTDDARIRALCEVFADATNHKDLELIMSQYAEDIVAFDCIGPVRFTDRSRYRQHWQACFEMCQGGFFRMQDLAVQVEGDLAFCHFIAECGGANEQGEMQTGWLRGTRCLRRQGDEWKVVHEHCSMPVDMQTMQVDLSQRP